MCLHISNRIMPVSFIRSLDIVFLKKKRQLILAEEVQVRLSWKSFGLYKSCPKPSFCNRSTLADTTGYPVLLSAATVWGLRKLLIILLFNLELWWVSLGCCRRWNGLGASLYKTKIWNGEVVESPCSHIRGKI